MNVIYLHKKPKWGQELKYSLRSLQMYYEYNHVYVVGYKPKWLTNVTHIPAKRRRNRYEDSNYKVKVGLSKLPREEPALLMHDDFYLIKKYEPVKYYNGLLADHTLKGSRRHTFNNALKYLPETAKNYDLHYPMPFINRGFDFNEPVAFMSVLGNQPEFKSVQTTDCKFNQESITEDKLKGLPCFSSGHENDRLLHLFNKLYPKKSTFER